MPLHSTGFISIKPNPINKTKRECLKLKRLKTFKLTGKKYYKSK